MRTHFSALNLILLFNVVHGIPEGTSSDVSELTSFQSVIAEVTPLLSDVPKMTSSVLVEVTSSLSDAPEKISSSTLAEVTSSQSDVSETPLSSTPETPSPSMTVYETSVPTTPTPSVASMYVCLSIYSFIKH